MKVLKTWVDNIKDNRLPMLNRMYQLLMLVGLTVLLLVIGGGVLVGESATVLIVLGASFLLLALIAFITVDQNKIPIGIQCVGTVLTFLILPTGFFAGGGINGGSSIWFVFCFVYISLMMSGRSLVAYYISAFVITATCYYIGGRYPSTIFGHPDNVAYLDSFVSVILMSTVICIMIIFQRRALETQNRLANEQKKEILELNRIQNHFFSNMSHEIRTPINTIIGLNELTLREDISDTVAENSLNIQGASNVLLSLINDILDMSKIESGKMPIIPRPYDVGSMLSEIVNMIWTNARKKNLAFHVELDPTLPSRLEGDEVRIRQILINILNNAIKYTEEGSVTLSVRCRAQGGDIVLVSFSVTDTGTGIKKENIPHLFSAFERVEEERNRFIEGTGLGLSIVKQLVDLMGGTIAVDSIYTKGTTFVVSLEQKVVDSEAIGELDLIRRRRLSAQKARHQSFRARDARILIVDDNELNLNVARRLLARTDATVDTASSGKACLENTMRYHYHIIFMDHLMPGMDGIATLHALRHQPGGLNIETPVIVLTANAGSEMQALYDREGFDGYLTKPVTAQLLEEEALRFLPPELVTETKEDLMPDADFLTPVARQPKKRPILISSENICDIPAETLHRYSIKIISYDIETDGGSFVDGLEIDTDSVLSHIRTKGRTARPITPDVPRYVAYFAEALEEGSRVIHITPSAYTSGSFAMATAASQTFGNVEVFDSGQMSSGIGIMLLAAAKMADSGFSAEEILARLSQMKSRIRTSFLLESTEFLKRNGRVPKRATVLCDAFMLRPAVYASAQGMRLRKLYPGTREMAKSRYIKETFRENASIDRKRLFLVHAGILSAELDEIEKQIRALIPFETIQRQKVSCSSATMFGPNTFGLVYMLQDEMLQSDFWDDPAAVRDTPPPALGIAYGTKVVEPPETVAADPSGAVGSSAASSSYTTKAPEESSSSRGRADENSDALGLKNTPEYRRLTEMKKINGLPDWLSSSEALFAEDGVRYCGSPEDYLEALSIFNRTIEERADEIEQYFNEKDYKNYTIKVHALKSSARIIGAREISAMAAELEEAGNKLVDTLGTGEFTPDEA
ncbi:MAG: DegV family EDD domain-containing protein, partial [Lachnospiraceae bacterium]|nr:DegV family EDD domain-containing protein [Lachnospiraceae bacterium]